MTNRGQTHQFEMEMAAEMRDLRQLIMSLAQASPSVSGKASALVALAKDARLDGRVGAGDVVVSVGLAAGGLGIGIIGAAGVKFGSATIFSTGEIFSIATLGGCGLGLARLSLDAMAVPLMLSNLMDWLAERWQEWLEHQVEIGASETKIQERIMVVNPQDDSDIPTPGDSYTASYADHGITIKERTPTTPQIKWTYGRLWYFIEDCFESGEWARDKVRPRWAARFGKGILRQTEHKAVADFIKKTCPATEKSPGLWGLVGEANRPTLEAYLARWRWTPNERSNEPTSEPRNNDAQTD